MSLFQSIPVWQWSRWWRAIAANFLTCIWTSFSWYHNQAAICESVNFFLLSIFHLVCICTLLVVWSLFLLCLPPPFRVGRHTVFLRASVCPSVCLSVTNRVRSITWKPLKLYSRNFIQTSISMRWTAECKNGNSAFYSFWVIFLWTLCITKIVSAL